MGLEATRTVPRGRECVVFLGGLASFIHQGGLLSDVRIGVVAPWRKPLRPWDQAKPQ